MAANRSDSFPVAMKRVWARGGVAGYCQGLIPWAWIEASSKGTVLLFVASEAEYQVRMFGSSEFTAGILAGMAGGVAQAYATVGFCTCMKTAEITRLAENTIRQITGKHDDQKLGAGEKILASAFGGGRSAWNQPIEVIRVEIQSMKAMAFIIYGNR
ncbi:Mitochondrial DNA replication protein yhm2 [Aspergillus nanangensis]|uniref:Mitochondrial DNA replication protein yhm2 n=1 Tax=Aspergillus nanangensis TaxID=2582783 RepID=A0AAD4GYZ1_ASPNN|nr:Mitochondrial DNA replication protein yhm2 [Aspergillus nanangensis]